MDYKAEIMNLLDRLDIINLELVHRFICGLI